MFFDIGSLDRRKFLRGSGAALALPWLTSLSHIRGVGTQTDQANTAGEREGSSSKRSHRNRFACIYWPDGVPMPLAKDPAYQDWSWFPHGNGTDFELTKVLAPLEPLRNDLTIYSGLSHPAVRSVHGHSNADQFLTGADTGRTSEYKNSISLDQVYAAQVGQQTRYASLVLSTDGGTGTPRGAHTLSFDRNGRAIPAAHRPKKIFDALFVKRDANAARRLAQDESALDDLLADAKSLRGRLSQQDQQSLDEYLESVRETERKVAKARLWVNTPLPEVDPGELRLEVTPDDSRAYLQAMYGLMFLAFRTDSTRVATYQIGRENGVGISDHISRAVGFPLAHQLSHETKKPGGWKNFGIYCRFLAEEFIRFATKLKNTTEGDGTSMLDRSLLLFGSASSAFHLSRNYPLVLAGGSQLGFQHGRYLNHAGGDAFAGAWKGGREPWQEEFEHDDLPLAHLYVTMLQRLGVDTNTFAGFTGGMKGA
ncbi:MAG: DUF1552 domain-containing protein [Planctomycetota bacterium]